MGNANGPKSKLPKFLRSKNLKVELDDNGIAILEKYLPDSVKEEIKEFVRRRRDVTYVALMPKSSERGGFACDYLYVRPFDDTIDEADMYITKAVPRNVDHEFDYVGGTYTSF